MLSMYKVFLTGVMPIASLACFCGALLCMYRGGSQLVRRICLLCGGLHASGAVKRGAGYVPVFRYISKDGDEVDILGCCKYATEQEALQARRPLVFASERVDSAVARNAACYIARPLVLLLSAGVLAVLSHYLLVFMPD